MAHSLTYVNLRGSGAAVRTPSERANKRAVDARSVRVSDVSLINALQAHVDTLKEQLAAASQRASPSRSSISGSPCSWVFRASSAPLNKCCMI